MGQISGKLFFRINFFRQNDFPFLKYIYVLVGHNF